MKQIAKKFFDTLDNLLENDKDIEVNSVDELVQKASEYMEDKLWTTKKIQQKLKG